MYHRDQHHRSTLGSLQYAAAKKDTPFWYSIGPRRRSSRRIMDLMCILCHEGILAEAREAGLGQCFLNQCGHVFHLRCLKLRLVSDKDCPVCGVTVRRRRIVLNIVQFARRPTNRFTDHLTECVEFFSSQIEVQKKGLEKFSREVGELRTTETHLREQLYPVINSSILLWQEAARLYVRNVDLEQQLTLAHDVIKNAWAELRKERYDLVKAYRTALDQTEASSHNSALASLENLLLEPELQTARDLNRKLARELYEAEQTNGRYCRVLVNQTCTNSEESRQLRLLRWKIVDELKNQNATSGRGQGGQ